MAAQLEGQEIKGECALVLSCPEGAPAREVDLPGRLIARAGETGLQGRQLTDLVASELKMPRRLVYQAFLALKAQGRVK